MQNNSLAATKNVALEHGNKIITITNRTVRFGRTVYQTHNVSGFSEGEVDIGTIPWMLLLLLTIAIYITRIFSAEISNVCGVLAIAGIIWNLGKPKHYGFLLTLNSGHQRLFITKDQDGLKKVISVIYNLIETEEEATYQISVTNSEIRGNFIQGQVGGDVSHY